MIIGGAGDDYIKGSGDDLLDGQAGADKVFGQRGDDIVVATGDGDGATSVFQEDLERRYG